MFSKVLIANRGEIAVRVARACRELGIRTVGVYSSADRDMAVARHTDEAVHIGPAASSRSYQNPAALIEAARQVGAEAIHPGYGFLSEDTDFPEICVENGLVFIGPPPRVLRELGDKATARALMQRAGLSLLPGGVGPATTPDEGKGIAAQIGYPVIIKAVAGGGGRGMTVVRSPVDFLRCYNETRAVARAVFGDSRVYVERYLEHARHIEVQFLCDAYGAGIHLGTRDCSVQRRHQKLVEEAPAPGVRPETLATICASALHGAHLAGFTGVGTAEFLMDTDETCYFMEVNNRIQVEHTVTEMVTGIDLVQEQIRVAMGERLHYTQEDISIDGCSIECRVNAEDPSRRFAPAAGRMESFIPPGGPFTRVDTHAYQGYRIGADYDSLLAKVVTWAPDREGTLNRMARALREFVVEGSGVRTTIPFLHRVLSHPDFRKTQHSTDLVEQLIEEEFTE